MSVLSDIQKQLAPEEKLVWTKFPEDELKRRHCHNDYGGGTSGFDDCEVIAYSNHFVYIMREYDGREWIVAIMRNPPVTGFDNH